MTIARSAVRLVSSLVVLAAGAAGAQQPPSPPQQEAQRGSVAGRVTEDKGNTPLEAVQVRLVGTPFGAQTRTDGSYSIPNVAPGVYRVEAVRIGYAPARSEDVRVVAGGPTTVNLVMSASTLRLQDVVVSGVTDPTSGAKRPFVVAKLKSEDIPVSSIGSPVAMLQGKVAGVTVRGGGGPGAEAQVQLRNPVSFRANTTPMFIVDGVIQLDNAVGGGGRNFRGATLEIEPQDIESIEVIKGAAAAALYGQRAANGVISISTKRGASLPQGTSQLTIRTEAGVSTLGHQVPLSSHHRFLVDGNNAFIDEFGRPITDRTTRVTDPNNFIDNTWGVPIYNNLDAMFGMGNTLISSAVLGHNSLSSNFNATLGTSSEGGILKAGTGGVEQYNMRVNLDHRFSDRLRLALGGFYNRRYADLVAGGNQVFRRFLNISRDVDITARDSTGQYIAFPDALNASRYNPLYTAATEDQWEKRAGMQANGEVVFNVTSFLSLQGLMGYQRSDRQEQARFRRPGIILSDNSVSPGELDLSADFDEAANGQLAARFLTVHGGFNLRSTLQALGTVADRTGFTTRGDTLERGTRDLDLAGQLDVDHVFRPQRTLSYVATGAADYESRYILEGLVRYDGNSLLGEGQRWQANTRLSSAWSIGNETWWPFPEQIPLAKLRYSIGTAGNNPLYADRFERYLQNEGVERLFKEALGNNDLIPEKVTEQEMGIDISIYNRFGLELTYAVNKTKDVLREDTIPAYTGFDFQVKNLGDIRGESYEATLEAQWINKPELAWTSTLVADRSRSKITRYPRTCAIVQGFIRECEGYQFGEMWGNRLVRDKRYLSSAHQSEASLNSFDINDDGLVVAVGPNGSWRDGRWGQTVVIDGTSYQWGMPIVRSVTDANGVRTAREVLLLGQALPDFQFGLQNTVRWKRFTGYMQLNGAAGGKVYNQVRQSMYLDEVHADVDQSKKPDYAKKPSQYYTGAQSNWNIGLGGGSRDGNGDPNINLDYFMEDAGYLKVAELQVLYDVASLPGFKRMGLKRAQVGLTGRNLFTITGYSGYDPDVSGNRGVRLDRLGYPQYRTVTGQLSLTF
jgi:TonB-linked SusC/RagA family outer membrane protein